MHCSVESEQQQTKRLTGQFITVIQLYVGTRVEVRRIQQESPPLSLRFFIINLIFQHSFPFNFSFIRSTKSEVIPLMSSSQKIPVYRHMGNFGDGGWTLAMKIDGSKVRGIFSTFYKLPPRAFVLNFGKGKSPEK